MANNRVGSIHTTQKLEALEEYLRVYSTALKNQTFLRHYLDAFAGEYCSDPRAFAESDSRTWPTHITGGAVDLTLRIRHTGEHLFMGGVFDDPAELSHTAYFEKVDAEQATGQNRLPLSDTEALRNRRLLYWAMTEAGFANYPYEWWHFDWGTQFWVINCECSD